MGGYPVTYHCTRWETSHPPHSGVFPLLACTLPRRQSHWTIVTEPMEFWHVTKLVDSSCKHPPAEEHSPWTISSHTARPPQAHVQEGLLPSSPPQLQWGQGIFTPGNSTPIKSLLLLVKHSAFAKIPFINQVTFGRVNIFPPKRTCTFRIFGCLLKKFFTLVVILEE